MRKVTWGDTKDNFSVVRIGNVSGDEADLMLDVEVSYFSERGDDISLVITPVDSYKGESFETRVELTVEEAKTLAAALEAMVDLCNRVRQA